MAAQSHLSCALSLLVLAGCSGSASPPTERMPASITPDPNVQTGSLTVDWLPPTDNTDGSPLQNLAGFRILYGTSQNALDQTVLITNPGLTRYVIDNLGAATWYFGVKAYTYSGDESALSNIASKTIP